MQTFLSDHSQEIYDEHLRFLNECIASSPAHDSPEKVLQHILFYVGEKFGSDRCCIFEKSNASSFSQTFEWCRKGILSEAAFFQNESEETFDWILQVLKTQPAAYIKNINDEEELQKRYPFLFATLKLHSIYSVLAVPLTVGDTLIGFFSLENLSEDQFESASLFSRLLSPLLTTLLKNRILQNRLGYISYHDQLTGAYSRHAFSEMKSSMSSWHSAGVVYCDVTSLKETNDYFGHSEGNLLLIHWYEVIESAFLGDSIYRLGGDEFLVVCQDITLERLEQKIALLRSKIAADKNHLAIGYSWSDSLTGISADNLVLQADRLMYEDKKAYYTLHDRRKDRASVLPVYSKDSRFSKYISHNYFDIEFFFNSLSGNGSPYYLYVGDMHTNVFYISDNMKKMFGFESNIVHNLLTEWEKRICYQKDLIAYQNDIHDILANKRDWHDMRYQVRDRHGNQVWIHCKGRILWDDDKKTPLFFSGSVSHQEYDFVIDRSTNFPRENAALAKISYFLERKMPVYVISFSLNGFKEINEAVGRDIADTLLHETASILRRHFELSIYFYRMEGMRFLALCEECTQKELEEIIMQIRHLVRSTYRSYNINLKTPCSAGYFALDQEERPEIVLEKALSILRFAKDEPEQYFVTYSLESIENNKKKSKMLLALSHDVTNNMNHFSYQVQPIVDARTFRICGAEALLRWEYEGSPVTPDVFIPLLEKNKMIIRVGKWLINEVLKDVKRLNTIYPDFQISINISYLQIFEKNLFSYIRNVLEHYRLPGSVLTLELTETHFDVSPDRLKQFFQQCQSIGIRFALDDFGTAYSSLTLLLKYPANIIKIDRSLIKELHVCDDNEKLMKSIVFACHQFGRTVCVEGIDCDEELEIIKRLQPDTIQGFYFHRPVSIHKLSALLQSQSPEVQSPEVP